MSASRRIGLLVCLLLVTGCGRVVFRPSSPTTTAQAITLSPDQQQTLAQQQVEYQNRASQLDRDNQELESLLAQSQQREQLAQEQVAAMQSQLRATAESLAAMQQQKTELESRAQAMMASTQPYGPTATTASIRANNTLLKPLSIGGLPGVTVRQDGDTIRVSIAADEVFQPRSSQLKPGGDQLLRRVAAELTHTYPEQLIGIEGHADNAPPSSPLTPTPHHLTAAQASAAYDVLTRSAGVPAQQLFTVSHGANHPVMSNGTEPGRQANRRLEFVVYPETVRR